MEPLQQAVPPISILIAEDEELVRKFLGSAIPYRFPDIAIHFAENGRIGVELFIAHTPDIVITDINMPEMDGIQMAGKIKSIKGDTKIIVITANSDTSYMDKFSEIGCEDYLFKPMEFGKLFAAIDRCIAAIALEKKVGDGAAFRIEA
jgi:YesN/AraC family two-component response regulator